MRWLTPLLAVLLAAGVFPTPSAAQLSDQPDRRSNADLVLRNIHVIDTATGDIARNQAIIIRGDIILSIVSDAAISGAEHPAMRVIDGGGAYAIPALWDAHVHLMQNGPVAAREQAAAMVGHGIAHVRDMGSSPAAGAEILPLLRAADTPAPRIITAGPTFWTFALPYGDASGQLVTPDAAAMTTAVNRLADTGANFIKAYAGFDAARLTALVEAARARGLTVAGHAQDGLALAEQARIGMVTIEHADFSTFAECVPDSTGYFERVIAARFGGSGESIPAITFAFAEAADTTDCRTAMRNAAAAGLVLTPTMVAGFLSSEKADAASATLADWAQDNCTLYRQQFNGLDRDGQAQLPAAGQRLLRILIDAGVPIIAGSDSPAFCAAAGAALSQELSLLAEAGLSPLAVLQSATLLPGRLFGGAAMPGRIRVDGPADILLLATNPLRDADAYSAPAGLYDGRTWRDAAALAALRRSGQSM